jgi:HlyD family secretion protein
MKPGRLLAAITRRPFLALGGLGGALLVLGGAQLVRSLDPEAVATFEVEPERFVREVEAQGKLDAVKATSIIVPPESGRAQKVAFLASDGARLKAGDTIVEFDPYDARREEADGEADLAAARARIDKAESEGGKNERSLSLDRDVAKEELDRAETFQLTDEELYSRHQIIESKLDKELYTAKVEVTGKKLDETGKLAAADRALGEIDAGKARLKIQFAEKGLRSLRITAPHDGLLVLERNWRGEVTFVGDTLWPGQKIAELPDLSELEAHVFVHEAKVRRVEPLAKTRDHESPVKYFDAVLALTHTDPETMKPGQKVRAVIRMDAAEGVLAIPRGAIFEKDGKRVVYRRESGEFSPVEVTIGKQSISRAVVDSGLEAGDRIALRDPTEKAAQVFAPGGGGGAEAGK